jgi:hypothetical protein
LRLEILYDNNNPRWFETLKNLRAFNLSPLFRISFFGDLSGGFNATHNARGLLLKAYIYGIFDECLLIFECNKNETYATFSLAHKNASKSNNGKI